MPQLKKEDLNEKYVWNATTGDNPKLVQEDANHLSRKEGYEMLLYLNKLGLKDSKFVYADGVDLRKDARLRIEWMIKTHFKSTAPGRGTVTAWVNDNYVALHSKYPHATVPD